MLLDVTCLRAGKTHRLTVSEPSRGGATALRRRPGRRSRQTRALKMPGSLQSNNTPTHHIRIVKIFRWVPSRVTTAIDTLSHATTKFDEIYRREFIGRFFFMTDS